ncbi:peptidase S8/S53 domain-containing protein [Spinellus fusiger]|nr:peptidase S8/S53 domain-containing protein [Spinellus fusiger]
MRFFFLFITLFLSLSSTILLVSVYLHSFSLLLSLNFFYSPLSSPHLSLPSLPSLQYLSSQVMVYKELFLYLIFLQVIFYTSYAENIAPAINQLNDTDRYIVVFSPDVTAEAIQNHIQLAQKHLVINDTPRNTTTLTNTTKSDKMHKSIQLLEYSTIGKFRWYSGRFESQPFEDLMTSTLLRQHTKADIVKNIEQDDLNVVHYWVKDVQFSLQEFIQVNPPSWGLDRIDQRLGTDNQYRFPTTQGEGITVYVLDTGVLAEHEDFEGRVTYGATIVGDIDDPTDSNGHGTFVAGVCCGSTYGVAKKTQIVSVKTLDNLGNGHLSDLLSGIEWVLGQQSNETYGKSIVNLSLGAMYSQATNDAVEQAIAHGLHFTVAAGNYGEDACQYSPGSAPSAITVGAIDEDDSISAYSNFGKCVDIFAPGTNIRSAWNTSPSSSHVLTGTSMAAPHVAGAMALYLSQGNYTPAALAAHMVHRSSLVVEQFSIKNDGSSFNENKTVLDRATDEGYRTYDSDDFTQGVSLTNILYTHPMDGKQVWILESLHSGGSLASHSFSYLPLIIASSFFFFL